MTKTLKCNHSNDIGLYLGNYVDGPNNTHRSYTKFIETIQSRLQGWQRNLLSKSGRITLINSVLGSLASYYLSHISLTKQQANKCDSIINKFLWRHGLNKNCLHMVKWSGICKPKSMGGLGIRNSADFNQALLTKQVWKIFSDPNCLYSKIRIHKYSVGPNSDVLKCPTDASARWKGMLKAFNQIKPLFRWQVGDGQRIPIPSSSWYQPTNDSHSIAKVCDLMDTNGCWDRTIVRSLFSPEDAQAITNIITSNCSSPDRFIFQPSKNGKYTVKGGYLAFSNLNQTVPSTTSNPPLVNWKKLWSIDLPPKILCFLWQLCHNALPLGENLLKRNFKIEGTCIFGCHAIENTQHLFADCPFARACWFGCHLNLRIDINTTENFLNWLSDLINNHNKDEPDQDTCYIITMCWSYILFQEQGNVQ